MSTCSRLHFSDFLQDVIQCVLFLLLPTYSITVNVMILGNNIIALVKTDYNDLLPDFAVDCTPGSDKEC